jgi:hypothetical protein
MFVVGVIFAIVTSDAKVAVIPTVNTALSLELMKRASLRI